MVGFIQAFSLLCLSLFSPGQSGSASPATSSGSPTISPVIVIGFMGGFVRHDNAVHSGVQLAAHLRQDYPSGVYVEVFENRRREKERPHHHLWDELGCLGNGNACARIGARWDPRAPYRPVG